MSYFTLALIKNHIFKDYSDRLHIVLPDILSFYTDYGLFISAIKHFQFTDELLERFYEEHKEKDFFQRDLRPAMIDSFGCIAMIISGKTAVEIVRKINGATNPLEALPGTIRFKYGRKEKGPNNAVHGSDSIESAVREKEIIFGE
jgi:nucleoside-diphosphate kinase